MDIINLIKSHWEEIVIIYLAFIKFLTAIRDVLDKTPSSDDNFFEKLCTILSKLGGSLLLGQRPK